MKADSLHSTRATAIKWLKRLLVAGLVVVVLYVALLVLIFGSLLIKMVGG